MRSEHWPLPERQGYRAGSPAIGGHRSVVSRRKVACSLRTKEAKVAKERFKLALNALAPASNRRASRPWAEPM
jgi:hypothetical protein